MDSKPKAAPEPVPHIGRFESTPATAEGSAHLLAAGFIKDGFTVLVVTHDGKQAPPASIACRPADLMEVLGKTMLLEMDQLRECKVIVFIDAQPVFHEGKAYAPIKADVVNGLIAQMQEAFSDDDLSAIYVQE